MSDSIQGFPLTRHQRDTPEGIELSYWLVSAQGAKHVSLAGQEAVLFVRQQDQSAIVQQLQDLSGWRWQVLELKNLLEQPVAALYCRTLATWHTLVERLKGSGIAMMEEDIRPADRYLMERFIFAGAAWVEAGAKSRLIPIDIQPAFRVLSLDIETTMKADRILSIALQSEGFERVLMLGSEVAHPVITYCADEKRLLQQFVTAVQNFDPDILIGWNVIGFDLRVLQRRAEALGVRMQLGRDRQVLRVGSYGQNRHYARLAGRVVLDGIDTLKGATWQFERYNLEFVAQALLGRGKAIESVNDRGQEIQRLFAEDQSALAHYNLEDCRLVSEIFAKAGLIDYLTERTRLTGLALDKVGGSSQAFDNLYLPALHRAGYVAPEYASGQTGDHVPGGHVMESVPGLYRNVLVLDFKSLYPSIIRTFQIDPLGLTLGLNQQESTADNTVPGYLGAVFSREQAILPGIIEHLWQARDRAKQEGNAALSQAIKIQMNACYGVLGSDVCRFYDQRLSASITMRGHEILTETAAQIETAFGYKVIYGDTDSVFVWLGDDLPAEQADAEGPRLAEALNHWWQDKLQQTYGLSSALELQYEACYLRFLMPRMRDSELGSKKRYAGLRQMPDGSDRLVFKGLEQVRSDWTRLAKDFQQTLFAQIFADQPCEALIRSRVAELLAGERDAELIYHRRLRRPLDSYQRNVPPHVRAARQLCQWYRDQGLPAPLQQGDTITYVMSVNGPEAAEIQTSAIDYQHYIDKQLRPVADSILPFVGLQFDDLTRPQLPLF